MFEEVFSKVSSEASGERTFGHVVSISQFHRIQASPGFRRAAEYCVDEMLGRSSNAQVIHYPAETGFKFWHFPSFEEWSGKKGMLKILSPERLAGKIADFEECPISLVQRSAATPPEGLTSEMVYVGEGKSVKDYRRVKGKVALCDSHCPHHVYEAAVKAGAAGIVLYRQRPLEGLRKGFGVEGVRQYNSFWWEEKQLFGFVLTPEDGQRIISYLTSPDAKRKPLKIWAHVEASSYPGTFEVVTSVIPGTESREMVLMAHLCHPQPSAGDNASGAAALIEAHRVLSDLIQRGDLPQPRYGIRFLLLPEMTGSYAFLSRARAIRRKLLFGLNLDMVGQKQEVTGSTLCVEAPPVAASSFAPYLLEEAIKRAFRGGTNPGATAHLSMARLASSPFSGGSDHMIFSDPMVGVPTPMLIQWPDKYYHTSGDTPDKVSADVLGRVVAATCAYAYTCALASEEDLLWVSSLAGRGLRKNITDEMAGFFGSETENLISSDFKARFLASAGKQALRSVRKLLPQSKALKLHTGVEERALAQCIRREGAIASDVSSVSTSVKVARRRKAMPHSHLVVRRLLRGPVDMRALLMDLGSARRNQYERWIKKEKRAQLLELLGLYWADGKRSLAEISSLVAAEIGYTNPEFLKFYFELLKEAGIVETVSG